ncbi:MAG: hypothetical protein HPZ91_14395 [Lentisphaeria bacterium]|nr:hypothetical protein [Lentisphaeria bacterium]
MFRLILPALLLALSLPAAAAPARTLPAEMKIEPQNTVRTFDAALFGVNCAWPELTGAKSLTGFMNPPVPESGDRKAPQGIRLPLFRMSGLDSQFFSWKKTPGFEGGGMAAYRPRLLETAAPQSGLLEWLASIRRLDPDAQFVWTINMARDTPDDARDLAEFLAGGPDTMWGRKRIELSFAEPMPPAVWELGDELDYNYSKYNAAFYIKECWKYIAAIRSVIPDAAFAAHAVAAPWTERSKNKWPEYNRLILESLGRELTWLSFHPYLRDLPPAAAAPYFESLRRDIAASQNPGIRLFVTEPERPPQGIGGKSPEYQLRTESLEGCLEAAEWFIFCLGRPEIGAASCFTLSPGPWSLAGAEEGRTSDSGLALLFRFLGKIPFGSRVVYSTLSGEFTAFNREQAFCAAALKSPDGKKLYLLLNNMLPETARPTEFRLRETGWKLESAESFSAPELTSRNTADARPIAVTPLPVSKGQPLRKVTIPAKSLVLLTLAQ